MKRAGESVGARAILERLAADVDEFARVRRLEDLAAAAVKPDRRAELRRRAAEPDGDFSSFCARMSMPTSSSTPQFERAWDAWAAERHRRGETEQRPEYTDSPCRPR